MNAQQLKNSVLQMAVQGKLVPQDPNAEPAKALLEKIKAEKAELVKQKKIKADKNPSHIFRGEDNLFYETVGTETKCIQDEIPFDIPDSWEWVRLENLTSKIGSGSTPQGGRAVYCDNGIKFIRSQNVYDDGLRLNNVAFITEEINQKKANSIVLPKDILLNITGASIGRCAIVPDDFDTANINQHVMIIRLISVELRYWIHKVFISNYLQNLIMTVQVGTSREGLSATKLMKFLIPIPPLEEQKRIVEKVQSLQPLIAQYAEADTALQNLEKSFPENLKKSLLQWAVQGKLVPQDPNAEPAKALLEKIKAEKAELIKQKKIKGDKNPSHIFRGEDNLFYETIGTETKCIQDEIPFDIPNSWEWVRLGEIGDWASGGTPNRGHSEYYCGTIPWLKTGDLNDDIIKNTSENITELGFKNSSVRLNPVGSVLIAMYGATIGKLGILDIPATTNQACCACIPFNGIYNKFLFFYLMSQKQAFIKQGEGGAQPNISKEKIIKKLMPLPPLEEQKRITQKLETLKTLCTELERE